LWKSRETEDKKHNITLIAVQDWIVSRRSGFISTLNDKQTFYSDYNIDNSTCTSNLYLCIDDEVFTLLDTASGPTETQNVFDFDAFYSYDMRIYDYHGKPVYVYSYNNAITHTKEYGMVYKNKLVRSQKFSARKAFPDNSEFVFSVHDVNTVNTSAGSMEGMGDCAAYGLTTVRETSKEIEES